MPHDPSRSRLSGISHTEELARDTQEYLRSLVQFADQKAGFAFTAAGAILAFLYTRDAHRHWMAPPIFARPGAIVAFIGMGALTLSAGLCVSVVLPRTAVSGRGFFYWAGIRAYPDQRSYVDAMLALTQEEVTVERLNNCHDLAEICHRKYRVLRLAIWTWVVGVLATVVFIIGFASDAPERDGVAAPLQPPAVAARPAVR